MFIVIDILLLKWIFSDDFCSEEMPKYYNKKKKKIKNVI